MAQPTSIHNLRAGATITELNTMTANQMYRMAQVGKLEKKLFRSIEKFHEAQEEKDKESLNFWNTRVNNLRNEYAKFCAI